ncbi:MAG TPA: galactokinase, partial [Candidatus Angelobacter sp.]|nr:galactokinase [Candidatus Angelobacter sp.]
ARRDYRILTMASAQRPEDPVEVDLDSLVPGSPDGWTAYVAGTAWALAAAGVAVPGAELLVDGSVPPGAGLSSSASLECAVAGALLALAGTRLPLRDVALIAQRAENDFVGVPCGVMDQIASTHARAGHVLLLDARTLAVRHIPLDLTGAGLSLLVIDTRVPHRLADSGYAARRSSCEAAARLLGVPALRDVADLDEALDRLDDETLRRRVRHVVTENERVLRVAGLLEAGDVRAVGPVLTESHHSLRDDYGVSCRELDLAVDTALASGALGARMTGGGFGGSAIALVESGVADRVRARIMSAFRAAGLAEPGLLDAEPGDGYGPIS